MKHALLKVTPDFFVDICIRGTAHTKIIKNALPEDSKFVRAGHDPTGMLFLVLESNSFKDLENGELLPVLDYPIFEQVTNAS